jgi:mono/diheme cytochrome c family protein
MPLHIPLRTLTRTRARTLACAFAFFSVFLIAACMSNDDRAGTLPVLTGEPQDTSVTVGGTAVFTVTAEGATRYQWVRGAMDTISGATSPTLTLSNVSLAFEGTSYKCYVGNATGNVVTRTALLNVFDPAMPPVITMQPASTSVAQGGTATFTIAASGATSYQWIRGNTDTLAGSVSSTLTLPSVAQNLDGTTYKCVVRNATGAVVSTAATLEVIPQNLFPTILMQPLSTSALPSRSATFTVAASGPNLGYQWYRGNFLLSGQTSASLVVANVQMLDDSTQYRCRVSNPQGEVYTNFALLRVDASRQILIDTGEVLFSQMCTGCHGLDGRGYAGATPPLANSDYFLTNRLKSVEIVLGGYEEPIVVNGMTYQSTMPAWADYLTNVEVAGILTYLRTVRNDSTVVSCNSSSFDADGFAVCQKVVRSPSVIAADSISIREVRDIRDALFPF